MNVPNFEDLPTIPGGTSRGCAWDVWNKLHAEKTGVTGGKDGLVSDIKAMAKWEGVIFEPGDIFVLHTGWIPWRDALQANDPAKFISHTREDRKNVGLEPSEEMAAFIWNNRFAAAAADNPIFEAWLSTGMLLHEYILAFMGCPIGELWNLETLSKMCAKNKRYTFFLASAPLNLYGAVASLANVVAVQ